MATTYKPVGDYNDADLNEKDRASVTAYQQAYQQAQAKGDKAGMQAAHAGAEAIRNAAGYVNEGAGYIGGTDGSQYIPNSNLNQTPLEKQKSGFDTQALYDAQMKAKNALIEANYNTNLNDLTNAYNKNSMELGFQKGDINQNHEDSIRGIRDNTYRTLEQSKVLGAQRGITNSAQGLAMGQGVVRGGNESMSLATRERDKMLNELTTRINNLSQSFQNSKNTLTQNMGLQKIGAQGEAMAAKLGADLDLYKFDTNWDREVSMNEDNQNFTREMANLQNKFAVDLSHLSHNQALELANLSIAAQERLASMSRGSSASQFDAMLAQETMNAQIERTLGLFGAQVGVGTEAFNSLTQAQKTSAYNILDQIGAGTITSYQDAVRAFMQTDSYKRNKME